MKKRKNSGAFANEVSDIGLDSADLAAVEDGAGESDNGLDDIDNGPDGSGDDEDDGENQG